VELIGKDGSRQWASEASASSTYASIYTNVAYNYSSPFSDIIGKEVTVLMEGTHGKHTGKVVSAGRQFLVLHDEKRKKRTALNVQKIVSIGWDDE
jgi:hypothetical protein